METAPEQGDIGLASVHMQHGGGSITEAGARLAPPSDPSLSPILNRSPQPLPLVSTSSPQPEFAELLTPAKLRRKRRHIPHVSLPPAAAGPSRGGWQTAQGDVYRGALADPTVLPARPEVEEDALTFSGSSGSSSSSGSTWSIVSDLERGRRRTVAAVQRLGERIGVRRGSDSSESVASSRLDHAHELRHQQSRRRLSLSHRLTRTLTRRSSVDSGPEAPRREYRPRKREFVLLLPEGEGSGDRVMTTPSLPVVLDAITALRVKAGLAVDSAVPTPPPSRGGSGRGHPRRPQPKRSQTSFAHPPVPRAITITRPTATTTSTTLGRPPLSSHLSQTGTSTKPKSVLDLLHLASPASAPDLTHLLSSSASPFPSNAVTPHVGKGKQPGSWWLDVSCPTWEDLRDIGELFSLHPLTLEDVLQQDPREKLDMFDKLGYYFVMVRALDETYFKYTPGTGSVSSIGKASPAMSAGSGSTVDREKERARGLSGAAAATEGDILDEKQASKEKEKEKDNPSPELVSSNEKKKEGRRRGWGMGRAVGKLAGRQGEKVEIVEDNPGREGLEGVGVGAVNVYLAVFADGVISFHYDDISKHTQHVRDRILSLAGGTGGEQTSDWVAHGLIDSIVDAFFPLIRYVDGEVDDIDSLTIDPSVDPRAVHSAVAQPPEQDLDQGTQLGLGSGHSGGEKASTSHGNGWIRASASQMGLHIRAAPDPSRPTAGRTLRSRLPRWPTHQSQSQFPFAVSSTPLLLKIRLEVIRGLTYLRLFFLPISSAVRNKHKPPEPIFDRTTMLRRITDLRRLVTGLTRLLGTKHQVIGRMRKRAEPGHRAGAAGGMVAENGSAVAAYIGDVEDHILLLQTSLLHYEYILSHCQPAYLSQLSVSFHITRGGISSNILALSVVTISILPMQFVTNLLSFNVRGPRDGDADHLNPDGTLAGFTTFGVTTVIVFSILCGMVSLVRWWRWSARRKFAERRGVEVPPAWEGYWGWK